MQPSPNTLTLQALVGEEKTAKLITSLGGERYYCPMAGLRADHPVVEIVGTEAAQSIASHWRGEYLNIPLGAYQRQVLLDGQVEGLIESGLTVHQISVRLKISLETVNSSIARGRSRQP